MENHRIRHKLVLLMVMLCLLITTAGCGSGDEQALPAMDMLPKGRAISPIPVCMEGTPCPAITFCISGIKGTISHL